MPSMTVEAGVVVGGVDTHSQTHHAAVIDQLGRPLGDREFPSPRPATAPCWLGCTCTAS